MSALEVISPGLLLTSQDLGRRGQAHWGVARSGAADRESLRLANRLVGNEEGTVGLEALSGNIILRAIGDVVVAVTGARCAVSVAGRTEGLNAALALRSGDDLEIGPPTRSLRSYVGVRGGLDVPAVLGSRSYDQLGNIGPAPWQAGDVITVGSVARHPPHFGQVPVRDAPDGPTVLSIRPGPREDWLTGGAGALLAARWIVGDALDRTGVRLTGPRLPRIAGELESEGLIPGAIQLPPDGLPIVLGPDAGVTGGYPVIAVVLRTDQDRVGQLAPGAAVEFRLSP